MLTQEIICKKRDRQSLSKDDIRQFVAGVVDQSVSEGQISALCMAILLNGMTMDERVALTLAMAGSGLTLDWRAERLDGPVLDKHSTGGIGDKVSLMMAPLLAACGAFVPMISGRGLGHTGGTLDKMDSIPGYISQPDTAKLKSVVKDVGCAIVGATSDIAPADRTIYAVRDVTGTVESLDLITASILSKKLAAGLEGLVMDVKFGTGAFMQKYDDAKALAQSIVCVANGAGLPCVALMTDMNEALGRTAGNAIEVREAIEFLRCEHIDQRLYEVTMALTAELLYIGKIVPSVDKGLEMAVKHLRDGRAADFFERMVHALGGPADIIGNFNAHLKLAPLVHEVHADGVGVVAGVDARKIGLAIIELGGGRRVASDTIDHGVGLAAVAAIGDKVGPAERPLAVIYGRGQGAVDRASKMIQAAYAIAPAGAEAKKTRPVAERVGG